MNGVKITVRFYGALAELTGVSSISLEDVDNVENVWQRVFELYPRVRDQRFVTCLGTKVVSNNLGVKMEDVVSFLPPFSGG